MCYFKSVVEQFDVENPHGKKVYIFDQLDTRVDDDELLKYVLKTNSENLILKVVFNESRCSLGGTLFTSKVWLL